MPNRTITGSPFRPLMEPVTESPYPTWYPWGSPQENNLSSSVQNIWQKTHPNNKDAELFYGNGAPILHPVTPARNRHEVPGALVRQYDPLSGDHRAAPGQPQNFVNNPPARQAIQQQYLIVLDAPQLSQVSQISADVAKKYGAKRVLIRSGNHDHTDQGTRPHPWHFTADFEDPRTGFWQSAHVYTDTRDPIPGSSYGIIHGPALGATNNPCFVSPPFKRKQQPNIQYQHNWP